MRVVQILEKWRIQLGIVALCGVQVVEDAALLTDLVVVRVGGVIIDNTPRVLQSTILAINYCRNRFCVLE